MIEATYTSNINKRLDKSVMRAWKINDSFAGGVPDAFYRNLAGTRPIWVEYKFIKSLPKRPETLVKPKLTEQQKLWLDEALQAGEQVAVIVGCESITHKRQVCGAVLTERDEWVNGITALEFELRANTQNYDKMASFLLFTTR